MIHRYTQIPQNQNHDYYHQRNNSSLCPNINIGKIFCWLFSFTTWISFFFTLYFLNLENKHENFNTSLIIFVISYLIYIIFEFCSSTSKYLRNKRTGQEMYDTMGSFFSSPPIITFECQCYHYNIVHYTTRDKEGNEHFHTRKEKIITYSETYSMPYYSARDVSGLFYLNCDEAIVKKKMYIKLELNDEINFADEISYMDYEYYKEQFWRKNRFKDVYMDFNETRKVPGLVHHNLIKISQNEPCFVSFGWFMIFTLLTVCEFYKIYINTLFVYQQFKIRKIISTRYDLNAPENEEKYQKLIPQINLITEQYKYEPNSYNYINKDTQLDLPTEEEIEMANKYKDKIPDYQISSGDEQNKEGVILDNPNYSYYNNNEPPTVFKPVSGEFGLDQSQINSQGAAPVGFGQPDFQFNIIQPNDNNEYMNNQNRRY
jgi:hypothetical protein